MLYHHYYIPGIILQHYYQVYHQQYYILYHQHYYILYYQHYYTTTTVPLHYYTINTIIYYTTTVFYQHYYATSTIIPTLLYQHYYTTNTIIPTLLYNQHYYILYYNTIMYYTTTLLFIIPPALLYILPGTPLRNERTSHSCDRSGLSSFQTRKQCIADNSRQRRHRFSGRGVYASSMWVWKAAQVVQEGPGICEDSLAPTLGVGGKSPLYILSQYCIYYHNTA